MKAAQINDYGGKDVLKSTDSAAKPAAGPGEVLVAVYAAAVNPFDWKLREGFMKDHLPLKFPATLGGDFAGVVTELGQGVNDFRVGDEVYGQANAAGGQGSYAEFAPVKAASLAAKPQSVDFVHAAALPLAAVSAYQALVEHLDVQSGQKVAIHGGAGGIASFAIPLAKHLGAYVAATAAAEDSDYVKSLGADEVIDYKADRFEERLRDYDAVYDTVGGDTYSRSFAILKPGGKIVSMTEQPDEKLTQQYNVTAVSLFTRVTTERLRKLAELVDQGVLETRIDKTFPLDQAAEALEYIRQGNHRGKVVLRIKN